MQVGKLDTFLRVKLVRGRPRDHPFHQDLRLPLYHHRHLCRRDQVVRPDQQVPVDRCNILQHLVVE